jgi:hypothetical protein
MDKKFAGTLMKKATDSAGNKEAGHIIHPEKHHTRPKTIVKDICRKARWSS